VQLGKFVENITSIVAAQVYTSTMFGISNAKRKRPTKPIFTKSRSSDDDESENSSTDVDRVKKDKAEMNATHHHNEEDEDQDDRDGDGNSSIARTKNRKDASRSSFKKTKSKLKKQKRKTSSSAPSSMKGLSFADEDENKNGSDSDGDNKDRRRRHSHKKKRSSKKDKKKKSKSNHDRKNNKSTGSTMIGGGGMGFGGAVSDRNDESEDEDDGVDVKEDLLGATVSASRETHTELNNDLAASRIRKHKHQQQHMNAASQDRDMEPLTSTSTTTTTTTHAASSGAGLYSKNSLQELKASQKVYYEAKQTTTHTTTTTKEDEPNPSETEAGTSTSTADAVQGKSLTEQLDLLLDQKEKQEQETSNLSHNQGKENEILVQGQTEFERGDDFISMSLDTKAQDIGDTYTFTSSSSRSPLIVAGDEALSFTERQPQRQRPVQAFVDLTIDDDDDNDSYIPPSFETTPMTQEERDWEARVAARGIRTAKGAPPPRAPAPPINLHIIAQADLDDPDATGSSSLAEMKQSMSGMRDKLGADQRTLAASLQRRQQECDTFKETVAQETTTMRSTLNAQFQYYQKLRLEVTQWVGALRNIDGKLCKVECVLQEVGRERRHEMQEWYDEAQQDTMNELQKANLLDLDLDQASSMSQQGIVGGTIVDEFGRDIGNAQDRARRDRWETRRTIVNALALQIEIEPRNGNGTATNLDAAGMDMDQTIDIDDSTTLPKTQCDNNVPLSLSLCLGQATNLDLAKDARQALEQRLDSMQDALRLVREEVSEEYQSIRALIDVFGHWHHEFPEDYEQCFASLALAQLCGVLVRLELVQHIWVPLLRPCSSQVTKTAKVPVLWRSMSDFSWFKDVHDQEHSATTDKTFSNQAWNLIYRHTLLPFVTQMIRTVYDPLSTTSSQVLASLLTTISEQLLEGSSEVGVAKQELLFMLRGYIAAIGVVPILRSNTSANTSTSSAKVRVTDNSSSDATLALVFAQSQLVRLKMLVKHICEFWFPVMRRKEDANLYSGIKLLVFKDIMSDRLLPATKGGDMAAFHALVLSDVVDSIEGCKLLQQDMDLKVLTTPLHQALASLKIKLEAE
jgi:hypothetical protein